MVELAIDLETFSGNNITNGVFKYVEAPDFEILMIAYKYSFENFVRFIDLKNSYDTNELKNFLAALLSPEILKTAHNAPFEIACLSKYFNISLPFDQWSCTMALAAQAGLPFSLDAVAKALGTTQQKDRQGKDLIKYFTVYCKPTKTNGMRTRNLPEHAPEKWSSFCKYCIQDVLTEQDIRDKIKWFKVSKFEEPVWLFDRYVNTRGVPVDLTFVNQAIAIDTQVIQYLTIKIKNLTGIDNPNSDVQIKAWVFEKTGKTITSLNKTEIPEVLKTFENFPDIIEVLSLREKLSYTSIKKYKAMAESVNADGRIRGLLQYYGANRTGRFAGRNVQVQNLPRGFLDSENGELDLCRQLVLSGNLMTLNLLYDDVRSVLSGLIRSAFIAPPGKKLIISDSAQIEARVIAWLANESWRIKAFAEGVDIYKASASAMFNIPIQEIDKPLRMRGKVSELALGFGGSVGALMRMSDMLNTGLSSAEAPKIVKQWRAANMAITKFWMDCENAAMEALETGMVQQVNFVKFYVTKGNLIIQLPSGRELVYLNAYIGDSESFPGARCIYYNSVDQIKGLWTRQDTYGGKIVENIVQATARDILVQAMLKVEQAGYEIIMHVHDELVAISKSDPATDVEIINNIMVTPVHWAPGLLLGAETFSSEYYKK